MRMKGRDFGRCLLAAGFDVLEEGEIGAGGGATRCGG